ncbi:MAG: hypothetical protein KDC35_19090 [Acidobacteria bacterium]|nr:hypothetical protein [Acidobacteriota bacterium]
MFTRVIVITLLSTTLFAGDWEKLGARTVKMHAEFDTITVGAHDGTFDKIKIKVRKNGIQFLDVKVHFANGSVQDVALKDFIAAGSESRVIDLVGDDRTIKKVVFKYKSNKKNLKGKAIVELWGRH